MTESSPNEIPGPGREPWLAVNLSLLFTGLGQVYGGRVTRGAGLILVQIGLIAFGIWQILAPFGAPLAGVLLLLAFLVIHTWSLFDAHGVARSANSVGFEAVRKETRDPWLAVFLGQFFPGLGQFYLRKWGLGTFFIVGMILIYAAQGWIPSLEYGEPVFSALAAYQAYRLAPVRREKSNRLILIVIALTLTVGWIGDIARAFSVYPITVKGYRIASRSMEPDLKKGDRVLVRKENNYLPRRGDIVVFKYPAEPKLHLTKRVAAFAGEVVEIKEGRLFINGDRLKDPPFDVLTYATLGTFGIEGRPFPVPGDALFVLGDRTEHSLDSRHFGAVSESDVIGRVYKIYWPPGRMGPVPSPASAPAKASAMGNP